MSPEDFLREFEQLAETERGVERLRRLGLHLAVRGKMGTGRSTDPSAASLLRGIANRRVALADKLGARPSEVEQVGSSEGLPENWVEVPLGIFGIFLGGGTPSKSVSRFWGGSIPWVTPKDMKRPVIDSSIETITEEAVEGSSTKLVPAGAILMVLRGMILAHSFPVARTTVTVTINQDMKALVPIDVEWSNFLLIALQEARDRVLASIERSSHGTCRLDSDVLLHLPVRLPPLPEQKRIVEKVDQLMALCDELEAKQKQKREKVVSFNKAALSAVVHATDKSGLKSSWSRVQDHFEVLYELPENVKELRQRILQLAVMGKLVRQEGSSPVKQLLGANVHPRSDSLPSLPRGWCWLRLDDVAERVVDCLHSTPHYSDEGYPAIRTADVIPGRLLLGQARKVSREVYLDRVQRLEPSAGDILYSREGERFGLAAVVPPGVRLCLAQRMMHIRLHASAGIPEYFMWAMNSPHVYGQAVLDVGGSTSPHVNMKAIRAFSIPCPPPEEQRKISHVLQNLFVLCDDLEAKLAQHRDQGQRLMQAVVESLVA